MVVSVADLAGAVASGVLFAAAVVGVVAVLVWAAVELLTPAIYYAVERLYGHRVPAPVGPDHGRSPVGGKEE